MAGVNKVILIGNLGKDPEIRRLDNGRSVANFSLATSESYKNKNGEKVTTTEWHNVVLWTPLAEIAEKFLRKGNQVFIEGKITTRTYDDKDGNKKYITEVVGREMTLLGNKSSENAPPYDDGRYSQQPEPDKIANGGVETDDLPF